MPRRRSAPTRREPYFTKRQLEDEAAVVLAEYGRDFEPVAEPPVPIDEIIELHLKLTFEFLDMQSLFGVGDVHGALWVNDGRVGVDISLDPDANPAKLGRYRFTLAHEAGHWRLHRRLFQRHANQPSLLPDADDRANYVCRSSDTSPLEWQANYFAAALLMPRELVLREWEKWRGNLEPIYLDDLRQNRQRILSSELLRRGGLGMGEESIANALLEFACRPLADTFQVSAEAMRIRLENLNLLLRKKERSLFG